MINSITGQKIWVQVTHPRTAYFTASKKTGKASGHDRTLRLQLMIEKVSWKVDSTGAVYASGAVEDTRAIRKKTAMRNFTY